MSTNVEAPHINKDMTIGSILEGFPGKSADLADVMTKAGLHCVGCGAALFETLEQGIMGHGMSPEVVEQVTAELNRIVSSEVNEEDKDIDPVPVVQSGNPITLTENAIKKMKELLESENMSDHGLRVGVSAGGCAGLSYVLNFEEKSEPEDRIFEQDGMKIFMNPDSIPNMQGTVIDYVETLAESGFKFSNPTAKSSCGCGSSFS